MIIMGRTWCRSFLHVPATSHLGCWFLCVAAENSLLLTSILSQFHSTFRSDDIDWACCSKPANNYVTAGGSLRGIFSVIIVVTSHHWVSQWLPKLKRCNLIENKPIAVRMRSAMLSCSFVLLVSLVVQRTGLGRTTSSGHTRTYTTTCTCILIKNRISLTVLECDNCCSLWSRGGRWEREPSASLPK